MIRWLRLLTLLAALAASNPAAARINGAPFLGCDGCHSGGQGQVELELTQRAPLEPGVAAELTLVVRAPNIGGAGFFATTEGLGTFAAGPGVQLDGDGVTHQSPAAASGGEARFQFSWTPPTEAGGADIQVFVVATNGDRSSRGDVPERGIFGFAWGCTDPVTVYSDRDADGYGDDQGRASVTCAERRGWSELTGDCDDFRDTAYPGAPEQCNERDDNCNGEIDEDTTFAEYYVDADGDGYGDPNSEPVVDCIQPEGYAAPPTDCDDTNPNSHADAEEICDYFDNDCNDRVDDGARARCGTGWCERLATSCDVSDCIPGDPLPETCNAFDDDCDGIIDNGVLCPEGEACFEGRCIAAEDAAVLSGSGEPSDGAEPETPLNQGQNTPTPTGSVLNGDGLSERSNGTSSETSEVSGEEIPAADDGATPSSAPTPHQRPTGNEAGGMLDEQPASSGCVVANPPRSLRRTPWEVVWLALALCVCRRHRRLF